MKFQPKSEEEISNLIPDGEYPFEVLEATEGQSKKGNDMITIKIGVAYNDSMRGVFDYLLAAMEYKLRHFADTVGMLHEYEQGGLNADDLVGLTGKCKIATDPAKNGYEAKNVVKDYVKQGGGQQVKAKAAAKTETIEDDDIPF